MVLIGGTETSAITLVYGTWHVLRDPRVEQKLVAELRRAMPDKEVMFDLTTLENLPYLVTLI